MAKAARKKKVPIDALRALSADPNQVEVRVGGRTVATLLRQRAVELGGGVEVGAGEARVHVVRHSVEHVLWEQGQQCPQPRFRGAPARVGAHQAGVGGAATQQSRKLDTGMLGIF